MSRDWQSDVLEFHRAIGAYIGEQPSLPPMSVRNLRDVLVYEEMREVCSAIVENDIVKLADGIGDSIVVLLGTAISYGIDMRPVWDEIHRTNMLKVDGPVRADGKRLKPEGWQPPDVAELLSRQMK